jgi:hypothetical protein
VPPLPTVTETVEVKLDAKNIIRTKTPPPPAAPPFLTCDAGALMPDPPPPPAPHISTITKLAPDGLVHVPDVVNVWRFAPAGAAHVGAALEPPEIKTSPELPKEGEAPTPMAREEFSVRPVFPAA